jgi:hypothetical protein
MSDTQGNNQQNEEHSPPRESVPAPPPPIPPEHEPNSPPANQPRNPSENGPPPRERENRWIIRCQIALVVIGLLQAIFVCWQLLLIDRQLDQMNNQSFEMRRANGAAIVSAKAAKDAAQIAGDAAKGSDEQFKILNRPYMVPEKVSFREVRDGSRVEAEALFKNTGKMPAVRTRWAYNFKFSDAPPTAAEFEALEKVSRNKSSSGIIGADLSPPFSATSKFPITSKEIAEMTSGAKTLYFYAVVTYNTVWETENYYISTLSIFYDVSQPTGNHPGFKIGIATEIGNDIK